MLVFQAARWLMERDVARQVGNLPPSFVPFRDSDVDLFFDHEKGKLGLFELIDVKEYAASILGRKTDIMTRDSLHKTLRRKMEATAVRVF
jgi:hypothetical protein